jgi:endonuclease/exonuclease/phosphatase family metal-dependent hydrolase
MPERIVAILESLDADFIALQEVEDRQYAGAPVGRFFSERLGRHAYSGTTLQRGDAAYGNLLLARQEAAAVRAHDISVPRAEPRGAIEADFNIGECHLRLVATHFGLRYPERLAQARQLLSDIDYGDADINVLAGDFNEWWPRSRSLQLFRGAFGPGSRARTFPSRMPMIALDRIYVEPQMAVVDVRAVTTAACRLASDHLPLICDLQLCA